MKKVLFLVLTTLIFEFTNAQTLEKLRCEYEENPFGLEISKPRLSWQIKSTTRATKQTAFQVLVADNEADLKKDIGNVWNSGMVKSDQIFNIEYAGKTLESRKRYVWKVKIWNEKNKPTPYSEPASWEMALLQKSDWSAHWIGKNGTEGKAGTPPKSIELQKEFNLAKRATRARIYVTGIGAYHLIFNGKKVGQDILSPGFSDYSKKLNYQIYEISNDDLTIGVNFITATLGNAWLSSGVGFGGEKTNFSDAPCRLLFQLELEFYDGSRQMVISDGSWKTRLSPIVSNTIFNGETYDARLEYGKDWENASLMDDVGNESFNIKNMEIKPSSSQQLRIIKEVKSIKITEPRKGRYVFDFGQNIIGFPHLQIEGKAGKEIEMKFAETLTDKGLADQTNMKIIRPTDKYILKGYGIEQWESKFSMHGFRYIEVDGLSKKPDENTIVAKVIYENTPFVENLAYSKDLLDKIIVQKTIEQPSLTNQKIVIAPSPSASISSEEKNTNTTNGQITSSWNMQANKFVLKLNIPANISTEVQLPLPNAKTINNIKESGKPFIVKKKPVKIDGITLLKTEKDKVVFEVGSGIYEFVIE